MQDGQGFEQPVAAIMKAFFPSRRLGSAGAFSGTWWLTLPHDSDLNGPTTWLDVAFQVKDLLPCAQDEFAILDGHRERRTQHGRLQV